MWPLPALLLTLAPLAASEEWVEVRSPNFRVVSDAGAKRARDVAGELERIRLVFRTALVAMEHDPGLPILAFAVRNEDGLRELLPEYWEREGPKPAGVFLRGNDTHYIVLRVDVRPEQRYPTIYHEYFHLLLSLNTRVVPVWLNEGLAEFWERTRVRGSRVEMGTPNEGHLELLNSRRLMPIRELLGMEENPHRSDPGRVSIFYAQAWALTHFLLLENAQKRDSSGIGAYLGLVDEGADPVEAFVGVFGALDAMEQNLDRYVRMRRMLALQMDAPEKIDDASFTARELPEATSAAARGRFLVSGERFEDALPFLERALALDRDSSLALEGMGFYHFRKDEHALAREWFAKAADLDSGSFLCHYYLGQLLAYDGEAGYERAKDALRRAIELNPKFGPAYAELGRLFTLTGVRLESARGLASKAVDLEPDNAWYWVNLGRILLQMDQPAEASAAAERARAAARSDGLVQMAERLMREVDAYRRLSAAGTVEKTEPPAGERRLHGNDRRLEGRFVELRCHDSGSRFEFVVESEGRTFVFATDQPSNLQLLDNGESVVRDMDCGPQNARVAVIYTPSNEESRGELRVLEFLP